MSVESTSVIPHEAEVSAEQRVREALLVELTPESARSLATEYFAEQYSIFERRFVALRHIVPSDVVEVWDAKAQWFAGMNDSIASGDLIPLKHHMLEQGMRANRAAHEKGEYSPFGNALYTIGARMAPTAQK